MRLASLLCVSWGLAAAFEVRQETSATHLSTQTQAVQSSQPTLATISTSSAQPTSTTPSATTTGVDPFAPYESTGAGDSGGSSVDTDAGASGHQSGAFNLSKGGIIAICIVVAFVVVLGIASIVLFIIARRRQWEVRKTIRRASRRLTGRGRAAPPTASRTDRQSKRVGMQMTSIPAEKGHKRGMVVEVQDVEKGRGTKSRTEQSSGWSQKLGRNDWKK